MKKESEDINKVLVIIILLASFIFVVCCFYYICFAFVTLEANPFNWKQDTRFFYALIVIATILFKILYKTIIK